MSVRYSRDEVFLVAFYSDPFANEGNPFVGTRDGLGLKKRGKMKN